MKYILLILCLFSGLLASAQTPTLSQPSATGGWTNPNPSAFGTVSQGLIIWKQFGIPTGNGAPSGTQKYDTHNSLLYFDSTNNRLYSYNPKTQTWTGSAGNPYPITFAYNSSNDSLVLTLSDGTRFPASITGTPIVTDSTQIQYNWIGDSIVRAAYYSQTDSAFGLIVNPSPDGIFAGRNNYVYQKIGTDTAAESYQYFWPDTNNTFYNKSEEVIYTFNGSAWSPSPKTWIDILNRDRKNLNGGTYFYYDVILKTNKIQRIRIGRDGRVWIYDLAHDGDDSSWVAGVTRSGLLYSKELKDLVITTVGTSGPATLVGDTLNIPEYAGGGGGTVESVTGNPTGLVDNTDPANPVVTGVNQSQLDDSTAAIRSAFPTGGSTQITVDTTITATAAQTTFTVTTIGVPASKTDYKLYRNDCPIATDKYSASGNNITLVGGMDAGDKIYYWRIK